MVNKAEIEQNVAGSLLQIKAIKLQPNEPFTWASGWKSPIYCDNRITLSHPSIRTYIRQQLSDLVREAFGSVEVIAGVATAGIPQGVLVAQELGLPFVYVRAKAKDHGRGNLIEGELHPGQRVVVIEDLISTGQSSLLVVEALRQAGCDVAGLVAIFSYSLDIAENNFKSVKCPYFTLSNYEALIQYGTDNNFIKPEELKLLRKWRENPSEWGKTVEKTA